MVVLGRDRVWGGGAEGIFVFDMLCATVCAKGTCIEAWELGVAPWLSHWVFLPGLRPEIEARFFGDAGEYPFSLPSLRRDVPSGSWDYDLVSFVDGGCFLCFGGVFGTSGGGPT